MLETIRDEKGDIIACLEWYLVDINGNYNHKGEYVWCNQLEISKSHQQNGSLGMIRYFYSRIA